MEWISVKDRLPELEQDVLVHDNHAPGCPGGVADSCWAGNTDVSARWGNENDWEWICYMSAIHDPNLHFFPTHWMPLPEPPNLER